MGRTKNSVKNIVFAIGLQGLTILANFVIRTIMIKRLGMEVTSLNGLFTEVLAALSMAELGIGTAIVYNLYKPLVKKDYTKVRQLMGLFQSAYQIIALATFIIGAAICPWIDKLVKFKGDLYTVGYIRLVYMLFVLDLSMSYLFTYKVSLMNADQKSHVQSKISMVITPIALAIKISVLILTNNFVCFLAVSICITFLGNIVRSKVVDKYYPWLKGKKETLPREEQKEVFANIRNLFIKSLSGKITNSTDNILISALVNTLQVGYYTNYSLPIGVFRQLANQVAYGGVGASLGNLLATEDEKHCERVFYRLEYLFFVLGSLAAVGVFCCIAPFIRIWLEKDEYLFGIDIVFILCLNLFIEIINRPLWAIMEVSGLFKYDKYVSIIGSVVNLIVSICLGMKIGMLGIFIGTFLTYVIQSILKSLLLFKMRLHLKPLKQYILLGCMCGGMLIQMWVSYALCSNLHFDNQWVSFVVYGIIASCIVGISTIVATFRTDAFHYYKGLVWGKVAKILNK